MHRDPQVHPDIDSVKSLIEARDFTKALDLIELALSAFEMREIERSELLLAKAKCLYFTGEYGLAQSTSETAIGLVRESNSHFLYAELKFVLGRVLNLMGQHERAIEELTEAYAFFRRADDQIMALSPLMSIGLIHQSKGDLTQAHSIFLSIATKAEQKDSLVDLILSCFNACRTEMLLGDFQIATTRLERAERLAADEVFLSRVKNLNGMIAAWRLQYKHASNLLSSCRKWYDQRKQKRDVAVCLEYLGLNEYFAGNYQKAKDYYQQVLDMPEPTASAVAQTLRMLTDVHIAEGHWELARQTAAKADAAITRISERIELGALWRAYGQIHAHDGNRDEARAFFTKSIELLRQLGARYELALSYFDAGRSEVFSASERMEHLRTARSLFVDMDVPKRVVQVDAAIKQLEADCHPGERRNQASTTVLRVAA